MAEDGELSTIQPDTKHDNGIQYHYATTGHKFLFDQTTILEQEPNSYKRKIIEGMHIANKKDSVVNIIAGQRISQCWTPLIAQLNL